MELLPEALSLWLIEYGSLALFVLLALGIICVPIPEDTLMIFTGILINQGYLPAGRAYLAACLGSICGISTSYFLGHKVGDVIIKKYGGYFGLTQARMERVHWWFERFGGIFLVIGYFIPGLRHLTGLFAGFSAMEYKHFVCYAYPGAIAWVSLMLSIGFFFGHCCEGVIEIFENNIEIVIPILALFFLIYLFFKFRKKKKQRSN